MSTVIFLLVFVLGINSYLKQKYVGSVIAYAFLVTNGFIINFFGSPAIKGGDLGLLLLAIFCVVGRIRNKKFFSVKGFTFAPIVATFLAFFFFEFIYSCILGVDTLKNIVAVLRQYFSIAIYFAFRVVPINKLILSCRYILKLVILASVLFVLQYVTHIPLVNTFIGESNTDYRMSVIPPFLMVATLFILFYGQKIKHRYIILCLFLCVMLISQNRTPLYGMLLQIAAFVALAKNYKHRFAVILVAAIATPFVSSMLEYRQEKDNRASFMSYNETIKHVRDGDFATMAASSNFMFRIALCAERADYIINNPDKLLLGVGAMHEESKNNNFNFIVGTRYRGANGDIFKGQLQSGDTTWGTIIIRYGLIGVSTTLFFLLYAIWNFYKNKQYNISMLGFVCLIGILVTSISQYQTFTYEYLFLYAILFLLFEKTKKQQFC